MSYLQTLSHIGQDSLEQAIFWAQSANFYVQVFTILTCILLAWFITQRIKPTGSSTTSEQPLIKTLIIQAKTKMLLIALPIMALVTLSFAVAILDKVDEPSTLVKAAQSWAVIVLIFYTVQHFVSNLFLDALLKWVGIPLAILGIFGLLPPTIAFLDSIAFHLGNIHITVYALLKLLVFGTVLFWLGAWSNRYGQLIIRSKENLDLRTREVFAKLFQIALFLVIFLLLLQGVGLDLTALAVFGGALGVGIGFGLQQIASNFISGMIILLDKSMAIGDYIEMDDGKAGILKKLDMRSSSLQTYDGKVVVVPNEKFITSTFINWTNEDPRQRYTLTFSVAYDSDIPAIPALILDAVKQHPQVLLEPEQPDCEIIEFADSGVVFQLEYWIDGIDDGRNRVASDLYMIIWITLHDNKISIPFPQREVRILKENDI
jgi:small-conductance mechanosensitive channel